MRNQYDEDDVAKFIDHLITGISADFPADRPLNIVGIRTRGETLATRVSAALAARNYSALGRGVLDITLYRDDLSEIGPRPMVRPTKIDVDLNAAPLLLIDDVLFTGRSVRAALDALSDFGRPGAIRLAVLVDRGGRELPIQPDYVGLKLTDVPRTHHVQVRLREIDAADEIEVGPGK